MKFVKYCYFGLAIVAALFLLVSLLPIPRF